MHHSIHKTERDSLTQTLWFYSAAFTGKELDAETGYSYFGARYYDPATLAAWLSVNPMADKYPSISPYAYCAWNPLKLVDPEGREIWHPEIYENGTIYYVADKGDSKTTFSKQYGVTSQTTNAIFDKAGVEKIGIETKTSSNIVKNITHNQILKLDWNYATDKQKAYQAMFGILHSYLNNETANMNNYFSNMPLNGEPAQLSLKNVEIPLYNGKSMKLQAFNSTFCTEQPKVGLPQPPKYDLSVDKVSQSFLQIPFSGGVGINRITVSYSRSAESEFQRSYY